MSIKNYHKLETTIQKVESGLKPLVDKDIRQDLADIVFVMAELRHAEYMLQMGASIEDVQKRLVNGLFDY
jgi:hypothetical protein